MCLIPGFPAALLDDPPHPSPPPTTREQLQQCSSEDEQNPKVRKPYTITKQREKWSDDEHDKFLQAVKLYGRAWRRIEEHVGSKTAVQIRSHAQKFFSKVAKESTTAGVTTSNTAAPAPAIIEIPPPRPKKRPLHPYPRKLDSTPNKRAAAPPVTISVFPPAVAKASIQQLHESGSPKSVLSAAELNKAALPTAPISNACCASASSDSSITGPDEEQMEHHRNDRVFTSSTGFPSSATMTRVEEAQHKDPEQSPELVSFQLFGHTVVVCNPQQPSSTTEASSRLQPTHNPPPPSDDSEGGTLSTESDPQDSEILTPTTPAVVSRPCDLLPMLCASLSPPHEQQQHQAAPHPLCFFYGAAVPLPFMRFPILPTHHHNHCSQMPGDASSDVAFQQEAPRTPNRTTVQRDAHPSGLTTIRTAFPHHATGFVPYKRQSVLHLPSSPCTGDDPNR